MNICGLQGLGDPGGSTSHAGDLVLVHQNTKLCTRLDNRRPIGANHARLRSVNSPQLQMLACPQTRIQHARLPTNHPLAVPTGQHHARVIRKLPVPRQRPHNRKIRLRGCNMCPIRTGIRDRDVINRRRKRLSLQILERGTNNRRGLLRLIRQRARRIKIACSDQRKKLLHHRISGLRLRCTRHRHHHHTRHHGGKQPTHVNS